MIPIYEYFNPVSLERPHADKLLDEELFCKHIAIHTPNNVINDISGYNVAIIGVPDDRAATIKGSALAPDLIRQSLYEHTYINKKLRIVDLGNIKIGPQINDTYFGLRDVLVTLIENNVIPVIIGGSQDISLAICNAYEYLKSLFIYTTIDNKIDFAPETYTNVNSKNYLNKLILENKNLFEYINIGNQACYLSPSDSYLFQSHFHEFVRLGHLRNNIQLSEHLLRDTNILSIDMSAVKHADAPGQSATSPNGFTAEEICQLAHFAGISENLKVIGIFDIIPDKDLNGVTSMLAAQIIWYFLDALSIRKNEMPIHNDKLYTQYIVTLNDDHTIEFYKSPTTQRWWVNVPYGSNNSKIIACTESDYLGACNNEIPNRWLKFLKKLN